MTLDPETRALLRRRLAGPRAGERPGGLGLLAVDVTCPEDRAEDVLAAVRSALLAAADGGDVPDLPDLDADWFFWSMALAGPARVEIWLELEGFPVSGFDGLRRFLCARGATSVDPRPQRRR